MPTPLSLPISAIVEGLATAIIRQAPDSAEIGAGPGDAEARMREKARADGWTLAEIRKAQGKK